MKRHAADVVAAVFLVALVYLLVRPRSAAAAAVKGISDALVALVTTATHI
jgi:hypothetical protein